MSDSRPEVTHNEAAAQANGKLRSIDAVRLAKSYLQELAGKPCEQASGLASSEEGWTVVLEVVELERVPSSTDILGSYVVTLDHQGEVVSYERVSRYHRSQLRDEWADGGEP